MGGLSKVLKAAGIILAFLIIIGVGAYALLAVIANKNLSMLEYKDVDMNTVADGVYQGEADARLVYVKVEVTVKDHRIGDIKILEHKNGMGGKAESITEAMIEKNSYDVDAISGATFSSEVIKSAVSKALKKGCSV